MTCLVLLMVQSVALADYNSRNLGLSKGYDDQTPDFESRSGCQAGRNDFREENYWPIVRIQQNVPGRDFQTFTAYCWGYGASLSSARMESLTGMQPMIDTLLKDLKVDKSNSKLEVYFYFYNPRNNSRSAFLAYDFINKKVISHTTININGGQSSKDGSESTIEVVTEYDLRSDVYIEKPALIQNTGDYVVNLGSIGGFPAYGDKRPPLVRIHYGIDFHSIANPCVANYDIEVRPNRINLGNQTKTFFETGGALTSDFSLRVARNYNSQCLPPAVAEPYVTFIPQQNIYNGSDFEQEYPNGPIGVFDTYVRLASNTELRILDKGKPILFNQKLKMGKDKLPAPSKPGTISVAEADYQIEWSKKSTAGPVRIYGDGSFRAVFRIKFDYQ